MNALEAYLARDRCQAIAHNETLSDRAKGAVLFADISGFTPLTEAFTQTLGARRGAEELTGQLNRVYEALIAEIENYDGSVIAFAGDAALCWFVEQAPDHPQSAWRAVTCAFALQNSMRRFANIPLPDGTNIALGIKVAVTSGTVRRFVVGDPLIRCIDVLAGDPVARSAEGERLSDRTEILLDEATVNALAQDLELLEWRTAKTGERFAAARALRKSFPSQPPPLLPTLTAAQIKPWLLDEVLQRLDANNENFLTELRPVVALFARFRGIDYDNDPAAGDKLHQFIARAQQILARYDGTLLELTIGDKGSYFYATFGAPRIHEDDARRAVFAGRELFPLCRELGFLEPLQVGISQGIMRVGSYGGRTRRTYGVQGDEVNLAARLMTEAAPDTLLVSRRIQKAIANEFDLEPLPPIRLKGKTEPLLPFVVQGLRETRVQQLQEAYYALPMIGRDEEFQTLLSHLELARQGAGQIVGITARAGMGKSRLTAEMIRSVRRNRESSYSGECQSFGANISYLVWRPIWRAFFGIDSNLPVRRQIRALESAVQEFAPERIEALPLMAMVLDLPIPENEFTRALEPEFRKSALHALLRECLSAAAYEARAQKHMVLIVLEDLHWIDPASLELLQELAADIALLPLVFLLNYRPLETETDSLRHIKTHSYFSELTLDDLTDAQSEGLIRAKLAQYAPENAETIPQPLLVLITKQAQGNPFYIEQLLDYMHDRGLNVRDPRALEHLELPNTLHRLVLSRIDQLNEHQQLILKAASIIGRTFPLAHLTGYFPEIGTGDHVRADLALLQRYDLTALERPEPEPTYLFKHIVTHQVAYESLAYATRAKLHQAYAQFLETTNDPERFLDLLAYHYDLGDNPNKRLEYLKRAGQAAAARFANAEAIDYVSRALALIPPFEPEPRYELLVIRERVFDVRGERDKQSADLSALEQLTSGMNDPAKHARVLLQQGWYAARLADHVRAQENVQRVNAVLNNSTLRGNTYDALQAEVTLLDGVIFWQQGNAPAARPRMEQALELARRTDDHTLQARVLSFLGTVYREASELSRAYDCFVEQLNLSRAHADSRREWAALNNLGLIETARGNFEQALANYNDALRIVRDIGDRLGEGALLNNLAAAAMEHGAYDQAHAYASRAVIVTKGISDRRVQCFLELTIGETHRLSGEYHAAREHTAHALRMAREINDRLNEDYACMNLAAIALAQHEPERARDMALDALPLAREIQHREGEAFLLNTLGMAQFALGEADAAQESFMQALGLWGTLEPSPYSLQARAGLAELALQKNEFAYARHECAAIRAFINTHPTRQGDPAALAAQWTCYRVHRALGDADARAFLDNAYVQLQARAAKIADTRMKRSFLEHVAANAEIIRAWHTPEAT